MTRYRLVTPTRKWPWRDKRSHAVDDAVDADLAHRDEHNPKRVYFEVLAEIESRHE